ncbi:MAG: magnesium transporter [Dehalococcoidia bacterium]|nr:magnesium transporter [Dehalococcoidia bacterium]
MSSMQPPGSTIHQTVCGQAEELTALIENQEWDQVLALLSHLRTQDEAGLLCELDRTRIREVMAHLSTADLVNLVQAVPDSDACRFCEALDPPTLADVLGETNPDFTARVLRELPEDRVRQILPHLKDSARVEPLLQYKRGTAGEHMVTSFVALAHDMTVDEAINAIRAQKPRRDTVDTLYVMDPRGRLRGILTLRQLVLARPTARLRALMEKRVLTVTADLPDRECALLMERQRISSLPVVDSTGHMLGVITLRELLHVTQEQATADMYHMVGLSESERLSRPLRTSIKRRLPWLVMSLAFALTSGLMVNVFEPTLVALVALASFLPLISAMGTNYAQQVSTIIIRGLATGELRESLLRRAVLREAALGVVNGAAVSVVSGLVALVWMRNLFLAQVFGVSMFLTLGLSAFLGAVTPLVLRRLRADPALGSSVLLATATDVTGFAILLGLATMLLRGAPGQ